MKKISIIVVLFLLSLALSGCPFVTPGLLYCGLEKVPEWITEVNVSDKFEPDLNLQKSFDVSSKEGFVDYNVQCWFDCSLKEQYPSSAIKLYFGNKNLYDANFVFIGATFDPGHETVKISEKNGIFEFECNSNSVSEVHLDEIEKNETGRYKIKHIKFERLDDGFNMYLTVDGKVLGPYHFTKPAVSEECK